jgi:SARP family transcriptional regulator, regulator of embCAB operon
VTEPAIAGWISVRCARMFTVTSSCVSPLAMKPHSHLMIMAISRLLDPLVLCGGPCAYVDGTLTGVERSLVQLCGTLVVTLDGRRVDHLLPGRKGRLLFVYLVLNRTRDVTSAELVEALWGDGAPEQAEATLRTLISKVRRAIGTDALGRGGRYRLAFAPETRIDLEVATDAIHRAESAAAVSDWHRAWAPAQVALITAGRDFLPGEERPWIAETRRSLRELENRALECFAAASLGIGGTELPIAERASRRLVEREPFHESGYRLLMEALVAEGNLADALLVYEQLAGVLREELGADPSPATKELHRSILELT